MAHFPSVFPEQELQLIIDVMTGKLEGCPRDVACAGWCLSGYVLDKLVPEGTPCPTPSFAAAPVKCPEDKAEQVRLLENLKTECGGKKPRKAPTTPPPRRSRPSRGRSS